MHTSLWHVLTGANQLLASLYTTFGLQLLTHCFLHMRSHVQCWDFWFYWVTPEEAKNLVLALREEFHLEETNSHQGNSLVLVRDTDSPLGAKLLMRAPSPEPCGRMFHANHHVPGERATYNSTAGHSEERKHSRAEKEGRLLITKPPLIESSTLDWLMNPRPPRATLSTNQHWFLLSGHFCTLRSGWLRELHQAGVYNVPLEHSSRALPARVLCRDPGFARAPEDRPLE